MFIFRPTNNFLNGNMNLGNQNTNSELQFQVSNQISFLNLNLRTQNINIIF